MTMAFGRHRLACSATPAALRRGYNSPRDRGDARVLVRGRTPRVARGLGRGGSWINEAWRLHSVKRI
jgi:hypothetical protein